MPRGQYDRSKATRKTDGRKKRYEKQNAVKEIAAELVEQYGTVGSKIFLEDFKNYINKKRTK